MSDTKPATVSFRDLNLAAPLLQALDEVGYETPSPIQAQAIPHLLAGLDVLGHAPTGTGKTAAFALPLLSRLDLNSPHVQVMTLTPTRELAIQVAEAYKRYAAHIEGFHVLPIYGGADYTGQIRSLKRGVHVVVGTPGRVMDHMRKGTLKLNNLQALVLDEADEMLRMGFIDEVEWILEQTPPKRQMALFSATMPKQIERIAQKYLNKPQQVAIKGKTATAETIRQRYWQVSGLHKLDAFTRILEVEDFDAMLVFVRTKIMTTEVAEKLEARGYSAAAMNGDMAQKDREKMVDRLKRKQLDILVATDVAARGLDVERISHVINYDIPNDVESYIHRIGRTGRAGRSGEAILFVAPRERRMLRVIEKVTRQTITPLELPTTEIVNNKRIANFKQKITDTLAAGDLAFMQNMIEQYRQEHDVPGVEIAAALAQMVIGDQPLLLKPDAERSRRREENVRDRESRPTRRERQSSHDRDASKSERPQRSRKKEERKAAGENRKGPPAGDMERFRIEVGYDHDVKPGNIVGAIANEAGLDGDNVGSIEISEKFSLVDLPKGMPKEVFNDLKKVWVCGQQLKISRLTSGSREDSGEREGKSKPQHSKPHHAAGSRPRPDSGGRGRPEGRSDNRSGGRSENRPEGRSDNRSGGRSENRPEGRSDSRPGGRSENRPEGRSDNRPDNRPDNRSEGRSDSHSEGRSDRHSGAKKKAGSKSHVKRSGDESSGQKRSGGKSSGPKGGAKGGPKSGAKKKFGGKKKRSKPAGAKKSGGKGPARKKTGGKKPAGK